MSELVELTSAHDGFCFQALRAEAEGRRRGGVIVIQEIFGLDEYVRADVERWAGLGFEVLAPSMFDRHKRGFTAGHDSEGMSEGRRYAVANGPDNAMSDIAACIEHLAPRGPVFIVGYCYGGTMVWLAASRLSGLAAGSSYYGGQVGDMASLALCCPVIVHLGRKDSHIPADAVKAKVERSHPDVPVYIYENAGHGFNNDGGPGHDAADADLARRRTLELFEAHGAA